MRETKEERGREEVRETKEEKRRRGGGEGGCREERGGDDTQRGNRPFTSHKSQQTYYTVEHWNIDMLVEVPRQPHLVPLDTPDIWHILHYTQHYESGETTPTHPTH